jgi:hypothetical protein
MDHALFHSTFHIPHSTFHISRAVQRAYLQAPPPFVTASSEMPAPDGVP